MKLDSVIDTCAEPIVVYDLEGRVTYLNPAFESLFGWQAEALLGKRIDFVPEDQVGVTRDTVSRVMAGETVSAFETRRYTREGKTVDVRVTAARLPGRGGEVEGMVVTLQDISELIRSRRAAQSADRAKSRFLSNISHEIRTPMNHVMGMIDLLNHSALSEEQQEYVGILQSSAEQLMTVVNDILDFSGMEAHTPVCHRTNFDLRALVDKIEQLMEPRARQKRIGFLLRVHQLVPSLVSGDPGYLRQVLTHLCSNAVKFTDRGEVRLLITLEKEEESRIWIRFEVRDTGAGIPEQELEKIFQSFTQVDDSTTRKYGGAGLGLAIVARLLDAMGSTIHVSSKPGKGSSFGFTLALGRQKERKGTAPIRSVSLKDKRILVADPHQTDLQVFKTLLGEWGCKVSSADSMASLFHTLDTSTWDLLLLDTEYGKKEGRLINRVRDLVNKYNIEIIILASVGKPGDVARLSEKGVRGYLSKPVRSRELYECIAAVLGEASRGNAGIITRHILEENRKQQVGILMVEPGRANRKMAMNTITKSGYRATACAGIREALGIYTSGGINLVILDFQDLAGHEAVTAIRAFERQNCVEPVPIIGLAARPERIKESSNELAKVLRKPFDPSLLLGAIEKCTWRNEQFLQSRIPGYAGGSTKTKQVFDAAAALERAMDDREFLEMLVNEFINMLPDKLDRIQAACRQGDGRALMQAVQSLKGASANMAAMEITAAVFALEEPAENLDFTDWDTRFKTLESACNRFVREIKHIQWGEI
ncbi:MAG: ATP-binding protein [Desulfobacterales bacterium]|nr:ATP-binding protein [Desulfobacterales bacterium]